MNQEKGQLATSRNKTKSQRLNVVPVIFADLSRTGFAELQIFIGSKLWRFEATTSNSTLLGHFWNERFLLFLPTTGKEVMFTAFLVTRLGNLIHGHGTSNEITNRRSTDRANECGHVVDQKSPFSANSTKRPHPHHKRLCRTLVSMLCKIVRSVPK